MIEYVLQQLAIFAFGNPPVPAACDGEGFGAPTRALLLRSCSSQLPLRALLGTGPPVAGRSQSHQHSAMLVTAQGTTVLQSVIYSEQCLQC